MKYEHDQELELALVEAEQEKTSHQKLMEAFERINRSLDELIEKRKSNREQE